MIKMAGKGSGWHGESRRHSLARKGIKTVSQGRIMKAYGIKYDVNGNVMIADGILGDLYDKAKSFVTESKIGEKLKEVGAKVKEVGVKAKEKIKGIGKPSPEKQEKRIAKLKAEKEKTELSKQVDKVEKQRISSREEELEQASHFGTKPSLESIDIDNKGRIGALKEKLAIEKDIPKDKLMDLPEEVFESPDADSIIAIAENSEKLIDFNNELKHDIRMIKVEKGRLKKRFQSDEYKELKDLKADRRLARSQMEDKIKQVKMSTIGEDKIRNKINKLESGYKQEYQQREIELGALRNRNRVTLQFMDDLTKDLSRNVVKLDKQIKRMTASGKER